MSPKQPGLTRQKHIKDRKLSPSTRTLPTTRPDSAHRRIGLRCIALAWRQRRRNNSSNCTATALGASHPIPGLVRAAFAGPIATAAAPSFRPLLRGPSSPVSKEGTRGPEEPNYRARSLGHIHGLLLTLARPRLITAPSWHADRQREQLREIERYIAENPKNHARRLWRGGTDGPFPPDSQRPLPRPRPYTHPLRPPRPRQRAVLLALPAFRRRRWRRRRQQRWRQW